MSVGPRIAPLNAETRRREAHRTSRRLASDRIPTAEPPIDEMIDVGEALVRLQQLDVRKARVVECLWMVRLACGRLPRHSASRSEPSVVTGALPAPGWFVSCAVRRSRSVRPQIHGDLILSERTHLRQRTGIQDRPWSAR
jgi:hypothetical protein